MARAMRHSGIPWIGEIPQNWETGRVKQFYKFTTGFTPPSKNESYYDENGEPWITISDINGRYVSSFNKGISKQYIEKYHPTIVPKGSLLYSFKLSVGQVAITQRDLYTNEAIAAFYGLDRISLHFLYYSAQVYIIQNANENIYGAKLLNQDLINNAFIVFPPLSEQQAIADFLDTKCAEIDQMVLLQEKFIEELKAYKQSLITETVTKGLNPNAKMKDSGVLCIGKVPQDWDVISLPFVFYNMDNLREPISAEQRSRKNPIYNYYGASGIIDKIDYYNVDDDVLLIGEDGANLKMRNLPLIYRATGKFWVNNHAHIIKPIRDNIAYMQYMLEALDYNDFITGSAQPKLSQDNLAKVRVCVPPISEQQAIADFLDKKCSEIDQLIAIKQKKIEEYKEYKKSLIYEYVTGKKEII